MATDADARKLSNLKVVSLRSELAKRNLDSKGVKAELMERLQKALEEEGHDPETYLFDNESTDKKSTTPRSKRRIADSDAESQENGPDEFVSVDYIDGKEAGEDEDSKDGQKPEEATTSNGFSEVDEPKKKDVVRKDEEDGNVKRSVTVEVEMEAATPKGTSSKEKVEVSTTFMVKASPNTVEKIPQEKAPPSKSASTATSSVEVEKPSTAPAKESKEKKVEVVKEDNDDSINLTIGEDEVKLFVEEEDTQALKITNADEEPKKKEKDVKYDTTEKVDLTKEDTSSKKNSEQAATNSGGSRNLWVSGLNSTTRATDLKQLFSKYGKVVGAKIVTNAKTPGARCYGYVTMLSGHDASVSMEKLNHTELHGRIISVERAKDDGTGPARSKQEKEVEKKKTVDDKKVEKKPEKKATSSKSEEPSKTSSKDSKGDGSTRDKKETSAKEKSIPRKSDSKPSKGPSSVSRSSDTHRKRSRSLERMQRILSFEKIKAQREKERFREKERLMRLEERKREAERERQREVEKRQKEEAYRLEKEREKLRLEREKIERERAELLQLERETQRLERERLAREKEELRRAQAKLEEARRATVAAAAAKRPVEAARTFEHERVAGPPPPKRRAASPGRHVRVSPPPPPPARKEPPRPPRRPSPEYSRRYESESSRKEVGPSSSHSSRDKPKDDRSRYDYPVDDRSKSHRFIEPSSKPSMKEGGRYERGVNERDSWPSSRSSSSAVSSSITVPNRGEHSSWSSSSDRNKVDSQPPWARSSGGSSSDRWVAGGSASGSIPPGGQMYGAPYAPYPPMGIGMQPSSYGERYDPYKGNVRKY